MPKGGWETIMNEEHECFDGALIKAHAELFRGWSRY